MKILMGGLGAEALFGDDFAALLPTVALFLGAAAAAAAVAGALQTIL